jgi:hypothetical protein
MAIFLTNFLRCSNFGIQYGGENIFSDYHFKNDNSSKKTFLLYFLSQNTNFSRTMFFSKNSEWRINQNGDFFIKFFEML